MSKLSINAERILVYLHNEDPGEHTGKSISTALSLSPAEWEETAHELLARGWVARDGDGERVKLTTGGIQAAKRILKRPADATVMGDVGPGAVVGSGRVSAESIAGRDSIKIEGDVERSVIIIAENVSITREGWELTGGDKRLSDGEGVARTIGEIQEALATQVQRVADATHFGPVLLERLLQNYRDYQEHPRPQPIAEDTHLKCYNQENVMHQMRAKAWQTAHVVELSGPSGIGKTHILHALRREEDRKGTPADGWGKWRYAYLNVEGTPDSFERIMSDFMEALGCSRKPGSGGFGFSTTDLAPCLAKLSQREGVTHVLFMLDGVDNISDGVLLRLAGEEGPVGRQVRDALPLVDIGLRLVIATRRPRFPQSLRMAHNIRGLLALPMDPLDRATVKEMLLERIPPAMRLAPDAEQKIDRMAQYIFEISGGHPGAINLILRELADTWQFAVPLNEYHARFRPIVLQIVRRDIIGDLSLKEYLLLNVLCVFRRFHVGLIRQLLNVDLLPANLIETDVTPEEVATRVWLDSFCEAPALIRRDDSGAGLPFAVHPILRHVLSMDLETQSPEYLHRLHKEAHHIYHQGLHEQEGIRLLMPLITRPAYTMEALYHYVQSQLVKTTAADTDPAQKLQDLAEGYRRLFVSAYQAEGTSFGRDPFDLRDQWQKDAELQAGVRQLPGGAEAHRALESLFSREP